MAAADKHIRVYQELAGYYDRPGQAPVRDRFLVLAADAAFAAGRTEEAERLRGKLLQLNPHHLLKPFASLGEALQSADVQNYVSGLRRTYPADTAESLLASARATASDKKPGTVPPASESSGSAPRSPAEALNALLQQSSREVQRPGAVEMPPAPRPLANPGMASQPPAPVPGPAPAASPAVIYSTAVNHGPVGPVDEVPPGAQQGAAGWWICMGLFFVTLAAGIALGLYTFLQPFLPSRGSH